MQKKVLSYCMALAVFLFVLFLPLQDAEAFRGTVERERIPVGSIGRSADPQPPVVPNPEQPLPKDPDQESGKDDFRYVSPARGRSRSGGVYVPVLPPGSPSLPEDNSPSPGQPSPSPSEPEVPAGLTSQEAQAFALLNEFRAENNLPPLKSHPQLVEVARLKAQDIVENNYFSHVSPTYGSIGQMLRGAGISYSSAAENLSKAGNIKQAHLQLVYSTQGHRQIMLSPNYNYVGIGVLPLKNVPGIIMVQLFIKN
jgi:uncharacterized protein YkwD